MHIFVTPSSIVKRDNPPVITYQCICFMLQLLSLLHVIIRIVKPKETKSIITSLCFHTVGQTLFEKIADCFQEQFWHIHPLISLNLNLNLNLKPLYAKI